MEEVSWEANKAPVREICGTEGKFKTTSPKNVQIETDDVHDIQNKRARLNGFEDYGHEMRDNYEVDTFEDDMIKIYRELEPMYKALHAYVRRNLRGVYGAENINKTGK